MKPLGARFDVVHSGDTLTLIVEYQPLDGEVKADRMGIPGAPGEGAKMMFVMGVREALGVVNLLTRVALRMVR